MDSNDQLCGKSDTVYMIMACVIKLSSLVFTLIKPPQSPQDTC